MSFLILKPFATQCLATRQRNQINCSIKCTFTCTLLWRFLTLPSMPTTTFSSTRKFALNALWNWILLLIENHLEWYSGRKQKWQILCWQDAAARPSYICTLILNELLKYTRRASFSITFLPLRILFCSYVASLMILLIRNAMKCNLFLLKFIFHWNNSTISMNSMKTKTK